jgi:hypothetical protein
MAEVAGIYQTGTGPGSRRLEIKPPDTGERIKIGAGGVVKDNRIYALQAVESGGSMALLANQKSLITIKDSLSVVLFGDTYMRAN